MGLFTKVFLLIIAQIVLIVACVYVHIDDLTPKNNVVAEPIANEEVAEETPILVEEKTIESPIATHAKPVEEVIAQTQEDTPIEEDTPQKEKEAEPVVTKVEAVKAVEEKPAVVQSKPMITDAKVKALFDEKKVQQPTKTVEAVQEVNTNEPVDYDKIEQEIALLVKENRIIFKRLSTDVADESKVTVEKIAEILKQYPEINIEVGGHTDAKGDNEVNEYISKQRAISVKKLLTSYGVDAKRLTAIGYGESRPIVENDPQGYSILNRRVEFKVIKD